MIEGRSRVRDALVKHAPEAAGPTPFDLTDLFETELDSYAELIAGPDMQPIGFMTRGSGLEFTARVETALAMLDLPESARTHQRALARWFEDINGFFKVEWHRTASGFEPLAAVYFRRRPPVDEVAERLATWRIPHAAIERARRVAATLDKATVHFVSAAFRPGKPVHHKLYFSQWVTPETRPLVEARLAKLFELFGCRDALGNWRANHDVCVPVEDPTTLFVSFSVSEDGISPSFKIDYPDLTPKQTAGWVPAEGRERVLEDAARTQALAQTRQLTFVGVRFQPDAAFPTLKYYGDVPGSR